MLIRGEDCTTLLCYVYSRLCGNLTKDLIYQRIYSPMAKLFTGGLFIAALAGLLFTFDFFRKGEMTSNEQVLLSVILTICSIAISWVVSHFYYEESHKKTIADIKAEYQSSLQLYASKAAEKVNNLSSELLKLGNYLREEIDSLESTQEKEAIISMQERMASAIHIINTLKSINDGSLSDWRGVIPEEIQELEEREQIERDSISNILEEYRTVVRSSENDIQSTFDDDVLRDEIKTLNQKLDLTISRLTGVTVGPKRAYTKKERLSKNCPNCMAVVNYHQKPLESSRKNIRCSKCYSRLDGRWSKEEGFTLIVNIANQNSKLLEPEIIELVRNEVPPQPWPKGMNKAVAEKLGISKDKVSSAINSLIRDGVFKHQVDGVLYVPQPKEVEETVSQG